MILTENLIPSWLRLYNPDAPKDVLQQKVDGYKKHVAEGLRDLRNYFVICSPSGEVIASTFVAQDQEHVFHIKVVQCLSQYANFEVSHFTELLKEACERALELGAQTIHFRLIDDSVAPLIKKAAELEGLHFRSGRVEFKAQISDLQDDVGTPITWKAIPDSNDETLAQAGLLMERASEGNPDFSPEDDGFECLKGYLSEPGMTSGPNCIHLGYIDQQPMAIVIAQIETATGWSRITYMAMLPEFRNKGLGKWVHRHGFSMMRDQGGITYYGGTSEANTAMLKLFSLHGCEIDRRMEEWSYHKHT
ncbi:MAG: GNAT family N-acetyltransferase [Deinococcaceae bacterium]